MTDTRPLHVRVKAKAYEIMRAKHADCCKGRDFAAEGLPLSDRELHEAAKIIEGAEWSM